LSIPWSGTRQVGDLWWGRAISLSMAIVALTSPLLGGIADYGGLRKNSFIYTALSVCAIAKPSILEKGWYWKIYIDCRC
jgi:UMF1 family MFS transporter